MLFWNTSSEINNSGFNIERSEKSTLWQNIGFVAGNGSTNSPSEYFFKDDNLYKGKYKYRLKQIDYNGNFQYYYLGNEVEINFADEFSLFQNFPNPFNPNTVIRYQLPVSGLVLIKIYDVSGKEVTTLVNYKQDAGYHSITFNGTNLSGGVYFYKLQSETFIQTRKMILIK
ncbi:MAG: T9SS type A sorting domain-containing protein [Ignavibacteria bacterium]|nr:T9SS type A sorting domain-containing protein [Ignavibacteria bacterium]